MMRGIAQNLVPLAPITLAQLGDIDASGLGAWLLGLAAVAVIVNQVAGALQKLRRKPVGMEYAENCQLKHAPIVQEIEHIKTGCIDQRISINERLSGVSRSFTSLRQEIKQDLTTVAEQSRTSDRNMHARINGIVDSLNHLAGAFEQYTNQNPKQTTRRPIDG